MHLIPAFLISMLIHLHLTALEPAIKDVIAVARNPVVRKDIKAATNTVIAYEKRKKKNTR